MQANVSLSYCIEQLRRNHCWTLEQEDLWQRLRHMQEAKPTLTMYLQLDNQRRRAWNNAAELNYVEQQLSDDLAYHLGHIQEIAGQVLDEIEQELSLIHI